MTDTNADTVSADGTAPADDASASNAAAAPADDLLASLRSRNSGLNSKVGEQERIIAQLKEDLNTARAGLNDKESADADLKRQLAEAQQSIQNLTQKAQAAELSARFPEAAKELGDGIFGIAPERLAAIEARLSGAKDAGAEEQPETPRPVGNNQQRQAGGSKSIEDMSVDELRQSLRDMPRDAFGLR